MNKYSWFISIIFWDDGTDKPDRLRNCLFSIYQNKKLIKYLKSFDCNITYQIYDFSPNKMIDDATHVPFPLGEFRKSEKINVVLNQSNSDFFTIIDADCFFDEKDYDKILELYNNLDLKSTYNFDCKKLSSTNNVDFNNNTYNNLSTSNWKYAWGHGLVGGLGGFYIVPTNQLKKINGFDESIKTWGREDGEVRDRILKHTKRVKVYEFAPYHLPHYTNWSNKKFF